MDFEKQSFDPASKNLPICEDSPAVSAGGPTCGGYLCIFAGFCEFSAILYLMRFMQLTER
jgi:hypothetical protein